MSCKHCFCSKRTVYEEREGHGPYHEKTDMPCVKIIVCCWCGTDKKVIEKYKTKCRNYGR